MIKNILKSITIIFIPILFVGGCSGNNPFESDIPNAPSELMGEALGTQTIQLNWTDNSDNEASFILYRKISNAFEIAAQLEADITSYVDEIQSSCVEVSYYLVAANNSGESSFSNRIKVPLLCGPEVPEGENKEFAR